MRLIDADRARETAALDLVVHHLDRQPTIDAVPVVRCKDCKHQGDPMACPMCHEKYYYDEDDGGDWYTIDLTVDDGFCHAGERWVDHAETD